MFLLSGNLPGKDVAVDIGVNGSEDQALEFVRLQRFHLPLHRMLYVEAVAAGEGRPSRPSSAPPCSVPTSASASG
ncbi:hypothetical protein [Streptomyces vinaceus]|uniref:hypothetical protein n=1 Tax=Streptomyces vinaceus TaxID=1960 RepID=UPI0036A4EC1D